MGDPLRSGKYHFKSYLILTATCQLNPILTLVSLTGTSKVSVWPNFSSCNNNCTCKHCAHAGKGLNFIKELFGVWVRIVGSDLVIHCDILRKIYLQT